MTRELVESVGLRDFWRTVRWYIVVQGVFILGLALLVLLGQAWALFYLLAFFVVGVAINLYSFLKARREARKTFEKWGEREIVYHFMNEHLHVSSPSGQADAPWHVFEKLLRYEDVWLLFTSASAFYVLPADQMVSGPGEFLADIVRANGGKVK